MTGETWPVGELCHRIVGLLIDEWDNVYHITYVFKK